MTSGLQRLALSGAVVAQFLACSGDNPALKSGVSPGSAGAAAGASTLSGGAGGTTTAGPRIELTTAGGPGETVGEGGAVMEIPARCGDALVAVAAGEACDDGNFDGGDGCDATCGVEPGWACSVPGDPCFVPMLCGNGQINGAEACDDGNSMSKDGCTEGCQPEAGWVCPTAGASCEAAACGDGLQVGVETCDDGNPAGGDGCSATCRVEPGHFCPAVGEPCKKAVCGNSVPEATEACDDGNKRPWDGCTNDCDREPTCSAGACASTCGDGMVLAGDSEDCDDANVRVGDGCSATCQEEEGWKCTLGAAPLPSTLTLPIVYRDFIREVKGGSTKHPDFETYAGSLPSLGLVEAQLGADGIPVYTGLCQSGSVDASCPYGAQTTGKSDFDQWYRDVPAVNQRLDAFLTLTKNAGGQYGFDGGSTFTPMTGQGWVALGMEEPSNGANFAFTSEFRYWFELAGGETLDFAGDDDVWVFINAKLLMDLGGLHPKANGSIVLTDQVIANLGMTKGRVYELSFFHAERHTGESNFKLTMNGFARSVSTCKSICGDGLVVGNEACDDGVKNGTYGFCKADCSRRGPHCGDGVLAAAEGEQCDDSANLTIYGLNQAAGCAPGCKLSGFCGDGQVDSLFGEQCDDANQVAGDECEPNCTHRKKCGDHKVDSADGETCDDGNTKSGDGCSSFCTVEKIK